MDNKEETIVKEEVITTTTTKTDTTTEPPTIVEETKTVETTTTTAAATPAVSTEENVATKSTVPIASTGPVKKSVRNIPMPSTVMEALDYTSNKLPNNLAMRVERDKVWKRWTWLQYRNDVIAASKSIISLGVHTRAGVNVIGFNSPEWHIAYLGAIYSNALPTGVYTTSSPSQCEYFATHSDAQLIFVEDVYQLNKYLSIKNSLPNVKAIIIMEPTTTVSATASATASANGKESVTSGSGSENEKETPLSMSTKHQGYVYTWEQFMSLGKDLDDSEVEKHSKVVKSNDLATLIYTSGTTSLPKGVMLTHSNILWTVHTIGYEVVNEVTPQSERIISYLPLSHIAEQIVSLYAPIVFGFPVAFAQKTALSGTLLDTLQEVRPTIFFGVPRVWEKIQVKIQSLLATKTGVLKKLTVWAQKKGVEGGYKIQKGEKKPRGYGIANALVFKKVCKNLGLDQCKLLASAAAPISVDTLEFFLGLGITVCEAYGMSELSGPQSVGYPKAKVGSVGKTIPGSEVIVAADGEILVRGPNCFVGYYKNEEASKETIDSEGWIHTGDVGHIDSEGFIFITDRKKELIITAGGENISPTLIEGFLRQIISVEQAVVIGDRQKYLTALITVNAELFKLLPGQGYTHSLPKSMDEASTDKHYIEYIEKSIKEINSKLPNVSTIKKFKILPVEFQESGETSELTPTKKLKRRNISTKYHSEIKELYGADFVEGNFKPSSTTTTDKPSGSSESSNVIPVNNNNKKVEEVVNVPVVTVPPTVVVPVVEEKQTVVETVIDNPIKEEEKVITTTTVEETVILAKPEEEEEVKAVEVPVVEQEKPKEQEQEQEEVKPTVVEEPAVIVVPVVEVPVIVQEEKKPENNETSVETVQVNVLQPQETASTTIITTIATEGVNNNENTTTVVSSEPIISTAEEVATTTTTSVDGITTTSTVDNNNNNNNNTEEPPKFKSDNDNENKSSDDSSSSVSSTTTSSLDDDDDSSSTTSSTTSSLNNSKDNNTEAPKEN